MSDFFIHNGDSFLPEYLPGIIGYGQDGAPGNKGENTPSIYFSSYNLDVQSDLKLAKKRIINKQQLSNNIDLDSDNEYQVNDIIVDKTGTFYRITSLNKLSVGITKCANNTISTYSKITTSFSGFNVRCSTSFLKSSDRRWMKDNPYYKNDVHRLNYSPKVYHHNRLEKYVYGNSISFTLVPTENTDVKQYLYKFTLVLPNGVTFDYCSNKNSCTIFLENKQLFGCFSVNEWNNLMNFNINDLKETELSKLFHTDKELTIDKIDASLGTFTQINSSNPIKEAITNNTYFYKKFINSNTYKLDFNTRTSGQISPNISSEDDVNTYISNYDYLEQFLQSKETTILLSYFIKYECSAYCEITDILTNEIYRVDINDIFIDENLNKNNNRNNFIKEVVNNIVWSDNIIDYDIKKYNFLTYKYKYLDDENNEKEETRLFNPMNTYVSFSTSEDISDPNSISEDGIIKNLYFVDSSGFTSYLFSQSTEQAYQIKIDGGIPRTAKFSKHSDVSEDNFITDICEKWGVKYERGAYKDSNRVIRLSFSNLSEIKINIQYFKNQNEMNVDYPPAMIYIGYIDHPLIVLSNSNPKPEDEEPGIYYLTKIVPPGYYIKPSESDYTKTSLAGLTESTINLLDFGISDTKLHYIEIGVTLLDVEGNTRKNINRAHRKSYYASGSYSYLYTFLNEKDAGAPDIRLYVSGVNELEDDKMLDVNEEFNYNNFNSIHCDKPKDIDTTV